MKDSKKESPDPKDLTETKKGFLAFFERRAFEASKSLLVAVSIGSFISLFLYGFYSNINKGLTPLLDSTMAANLTLQLTLVLAVCGLAVRIGRHFNDLVLTVTYGDQAFDEEWLTAVWFVGNFVFSPSILFFVFWAYLDFQGALNILWFTAIFGVVICTILARSEAAQGGGGSFWAVFLRLRKKWRDRVLLSSHPNLLAVGVLFILAWSFLLGNEKFLSNLRQKDIYLQLNGECLRATILGSTSNGVILLDRNSIVDVGLRWKYEARFVPFENIRQAKSFEPSAACN